MKILILKPSSLGDVIHALPVLRHIKHHLPEAQVFWWIDSGLAPLLEGDPDLAGIIPFHRRRWASPANWGELYRSIRAVRAQKFDWVIDLQCLARSGAFGWLANGDLTIGLDEPREGARGYYDLIARRASYHTHAVDWYLSVLPLLGVPLRNSIDWIPVRQEAALVVEERWPSNGSDWILLQPGARWLNKRWPIEHFARLLEIAHNRRPEFRFAVMGGKEDQPLGQALVAPGLRNCVDLTGKLSLGEMVEWVRRCRLMVTNDTGPMHVAAAIGRPVLALFGPTEPKRTGPYRQLSGVLQSSELPCVPCMSSRCRNAREIDCLWRITPAHAFSRLEQLLRERPESAAAV